MGGVVEGVSEEHEPVLSCLVFFHTSILSPPISRKIYVFIQEEIKTRIT